MGPKFGFIFALLLAEGFCQGYLCSDKPLIELITHCEDSNAVSNFAIEPKPKNFKKSLNGQVRVKFGPASLHSFKMGKCFRISPDFDFANSVSELSGKFINDVLTNEVHLGLGNGAHIKLNLNEKGHLCGPQKHYDDTKGLQKVTFWTLTSKSWMRKEHGWFQMSSEDSKFTFITKDFSNILACANTNWVYNTAYECFRLDDNSVKNIQGFTHIEGHLVKEPCDKHEKYHVNLESSEEFKLTEMKKYANSKCMENSHDVFGWLKSVEKDHLINNYLEFKDHLMTDLPTQLILDVPECSQPENKQPEYVEIFVDGQRIFQGSVQFSPKTGKAIIDLRKNNELLKAALASNAKLAPFEFHLLRAKMIHVEVNRGPGTLEGDDELSLLVVGHICKNGQLCGLVTKYGQRLRDPKMGDNYCSFIRNKLTYVGFHDPLTSEPIGPIYKILLGDSVMYSEGKKFSGPNIAYMYYKNDFAILGDFDGSSLLKYGQKVGFTLKECDDNGLMQLTFSEPVHPEIVYHYEPPQETSFGDQPQLEDELATEWLQVKFVNDFKGDAMYAIKDIPKGTNIAQYGGYRMEKAQPLPVELQLPGIPYRHIIGICDMVVDIPKGYTDHLKYNGTLGHKMNHNFDNSIEYNIVDSVRYGLVGVFTTIKDVKGGDQVFSNYAYSPKDSGKIKARQWYAEEWKSFIADPANEDKAGILSQKFEAKYGTTTET